MFKNSAKQIKKPITLSTAAMMIAVYVILYSVKIPIAVESRVSLTFLPIVIIAYLCGPIAAMIVGGVGDVLAYFAFPSGQYFPGFTVSAVMIGFIYGIFLYRVSEKRLRLMIVIATAAVTFFVYTVLNTFWLSLMYQKAYLVYLFSRFIKNLITFPLQMIMSEVVIDALVKTGITKKYL